MYTTFYKLHAIERLQIERLLFNLRVFFRALSKEVGALEQRFGWLWNKEMEESFIIIYGIKWKCERPFQMRDIEKASGNEIGQGTV